MDNKVFYEEFDWEPVTREKLDAFLDSISKSIPDDVQNIVDVGCGNGILVNELMKKYDVTGVDRNENALVYVKSKKVCASADNIPLPDDSFDLVLSTEMMEHLEDETLRKAIAEMKRISRNYILITVPNNEDIDKNMVKCPTCGYVFNINYHLQKITHQRLKEFFSEYDVVKHEEFGIMVRHYKSWLSRLKRKYSPSSSWIPFFWRHENERHTLCPNCEEKFSYPYKFNLLALTADFTNILISPKKPYYQLCLFKRRDIFKTKD